MKGKLTDAKIQTEMKNRLQTLCYDYTEIFSKHATNTGRTDLVQKNLRPKEYIKPFDEELYTLPLQYFAWLGKALNDLEKAGIISPSPVIIVPKKDPSTHEISLENCPGF